MSAEVQFIPAVSPVMPPFVDTPLPGMPDEPVEVKPAASDTITLNCGEPGCDYQITGRYGGRNSASMRLGSHRWNKHQLRKASDAGKLPTDVQMVETPALAAVQTITAPMGTGKGAPTATQLGNGLGRALGLAVAGAASLVVETDDTIPDTEEGDAIRTEFADKLSLSDSAARAVMAPVGKILAPTALNKKYGRGAIDNADAVGGLAELGMLAIQWRRYFRERRARQAAIAFHQQPQAQQLIVPPPGMTPAEYGASLPEFNKDLASPAGMNGTVMDATAVQNLMARGGQ